MNTNQENIVEGGNENDGDQDQLASNNSGNPQLQQYLQQMFNDLNSKNC